MILQMNIFRSIDMVTFMQLAFIYWITNLHCILGTYQSLGHGEYTDDCHWEYAEYLIDCPIKHENHSACIGNNIDIDTVKSFKIIPSNLITI